MASTPDKLIPSSPSTFRHPSRKIGSLSLDREPTSIGLVGFGPAAL